MKIRAAAATHVGHVRVNNEDAALVDDARGLFAVSDGIGGHNAGEVASRTAVDWIADHYVERGREPTVSETEADFRALFDGAHQEILRIMAERPECSGMGATLAACRVLPLLDLAVVAHVGDSRVLLVHNGRLHPLTVDHSEGRVLDNSVGVFKDAHKGPDLRTVPLVFSDVLILCSDGLNCVSDADVARVCVDGSPSLRRPQAVADRLVTLALDAGGQDNVTVVVVEVCA